MNNNTGRNLLPPMRPSINSKQYKSMSGYRHARGDFETEYNDKFEMKYLADMDYESNHNFIDESMENIDFSDEETLDTNEMKQVEKELKLSILNSYNDLIKERYERKKFIKNFGLLNELATITMTANYEKQTFPVKFQRFFESYEEYIKFVELTEYLLNLKKRISDLNEYRANGIHSLKLVNIYKNLKLKRLNRTHTFHLASLLASMGTNSLNSKQQCQDWFKNFVLIEKNMNVQKIEPMTSSTVNTNNTNNNISSENNTQNIPYYLKYKNNPLKIENYPDFEKLGEEEKEFCRVARFQPTVYLRVKTILSMENSKAGFCNYSRARKIAGIDVNKTRLIHNYMLKNNQLNLTPPNQTS
jgi:hypothetical protein